MASRPAATTALVCLSLLACAREPLDAPTAVSVAQGLTFELVGVTWRPARGAAGYELEVRVGGGDWTTAVPPEYLADGRAAGADLVLPVGTGERTPAAVRLRAVRGDRRSAWVEVAFATGLREPGSVLATAAPLAPPYHGNGSPITVAFENRSARATRVRVERAVLDGKEAFTDVYEGPLQAGAGVFEDAGVPDGEAFAYRVRVADAQGESAPVRTISPYIDVVAPEGVVASAVEGGVRVTWTTRSKGAVVVTREVPGEPAGTSLATTLSAGTTSWLDALPAAWPGTRYLVSAVTGPFTAATAAPATLATVERRVPQRLVGRARALPGEGGIVFAPGGLVHLLDTGRGTLYRDVGGSWEARAVLGAGVGADGAGRLHAVHRLADGLAHLWWDGAAWRDEPFPSAPVRTGVAFGVARDGVIHALHDTDLGAAPYPPVLYSTGAGAAVETEELFPARLPYPYCGLPGRIAVADDGGVAFVMPCSTGAAWVAAVLTRAAGAPAFSVDEVPLKTPDGMFDLAGAARGGDVAVLERGLLRPDPTLRRLLHRRVSGAWAEPEEIPDFDSSGQPWGAVLSPDGSRLYLYVSAYPSPPELRIRGPEGWSRVAVGPRAPFSFAMGFWPDGRFHMEAELGFAPNAVGALFEELPASP